MMYFSSCRFRCDDSHYLTITISLYTGAIVDCWINAADIYGRAIITVYRFDFLRRRSWTHVFILAAAQTVSQYVCMWVVARETTLSQLNSLQTFSQIFSMDIFACERAFIQSNSFPCFHDANCMTCEARVELLSSSRTHTHTDTFPARWQSNTNVWRSKSLEIIFQLYTMACERTYSRKLTLGWSF